MADGTPPVSMLDFLVGYEPGFRLVDMGPLLEFLNLAYSVSPNIAATGTTYLNAKKLTSAINSVLSASAAQNALILPQSFLGRQVIIVNNTNVALNVFPPNQTDYIIPAGASTPTGNAAQAANTTAAYTCIAIQSAFSPIVFYWKQTAAV